MAVGVETNVPMFPSTACGILGCGAPNPPLRQAAPRYLPYVLVQWYAKKIFSDIVSDVDNLYEAKGVGSYEASRDHYC